MRVIGLVAASVLVGGGTAAVASVMHHHQISDQHSSGPSPSATRSGTWSPTIKHGSTLLRANDLTDPLGPFGEFAVSERPTLVCQLGWLSEALDGNGHLASASRDFATRAGTAPTDPVIQETVIEYYDEGAAQRAYERIRGWLDRCHASHLRPDIAAYGPLLHPDPSSPHAARSFTGAWVEAYQGGPESGPVYDQFVGLFGRRVMALQVSGTGGDSEARQARFFEVLDLAATRAIH